MKLAIVYWSGTGNTEAMANAMAEGAKEAGAAVDLLSVDEFNVDKLADFDGVLFGCPAMGNEVLEEAEFEPMFAELEAKLAGVPPKVIRRARAILAELEAGAPEQTAAVPAQAAEER